MQPESVKVSNHRKWREEPGKGGNQPQIHKALRIDITEIRSNMKQEGGQGFSVDLGRKQTLLFKQVLPQHLPAFSFHNLHGNCVFLHKHMKEGSFSPRERLQWIEELLHKHEDLKSNTQKSC